MTGKRVVVETTMLTLVVAGRRSVLVMVTVAVVEIEVPVWAVVFVVVVTLAI